MFAATSGFTDLIPFEQPSRNEQWNFLICVAYSSVEDVQTTEM